ncbi:hypothetical protein QYE76_036153 [Lolium multiflorum]|uniref:DNA topoisomerase (ATP-hydrolyzing) n=1 Tax=Lolium multiflorum TaxID=4521 RepID=A0AAD8R0E8_LOLMU|nr:hypothetical protein QYE76_036153 [Lolium multiflorum]
MNIAKQEGLVKKFKLTSTLAITNMHLFGPDGKIRKYETPEEILEEFFTLRLEYYVKRKDALFKNITLEMRKLDEKVRFILAVVEGEIKVNNRKRAELFEELKQKGYESFPKNKKKNKPVAAGATDDDDGNEESPADGADAEDASGYDYLLSMSIGTLTREKVQQLIAQQENLSLEVERLRLTEPKSLWFKDLDALEKELDKLDAIYQKAQEKRRAAREKNMKNKEAGTKAAPKRQPKKTYAGKRQTTGRRRGGRPMRQTTGRRRGGRPMRQTTGVGVGNQQGRWRDCSRRRRYGRPRGGELAGVKEEMSDHEAARWLPDGSRRSKDDSVRVRRDGSVRGR